MRRRRVTKRRIVPSKSRLVPSPPRRCPPPRSRSLRAPQCSSPSSSRRARLEEGRERRSTGRRAREGARGGRTWRRGDTRRMRIPSRLVGESRPRLLDRPARRRSPGASPNRLLLLRRRRTSRGWCGSRPAWFGSGSDDARERGCGTELETASSDRSLRPVIRTSSRPGEVPGQRALAVGRGRGRVHLDVHRLVLVLVRSRLEGSGRGQALGRDEVVGEQRLHPSHDEPLPALRGGHRADVASSARVLVKEANVLQILATPLHETRGVDAPTVVRSEGASMNAPDGMSAVLCVVAFQTFKKNVRFADTSQAREEGVDARILRRARGTRRHADAHRVILTFANAFVPRGPRRSFGRRPSPTARDWRNTAARQMVRVRPRVDSARPRPRAEPR